VNRVKILQVIPYLRISWAGGLPVRIVYELSKALVKRGHEVTIYTTDAFDKTSKSESQRESYRLEDGIAIREFKSLGNRLGTTHHVIVSPTMISLVAKELRKFDIIHLHEYRTFQNIVIRYYAKKEHIPYVLQAHGSLPIMGSKQSMKKIYDVFWGYKLLKEATKVIAVTPAEAQQYKDIGVSENKIEIIPLAIDLTEFEKLPEKGELRRMYNLKENQSMILYLGRINEIKGLDLLVKVFAELLTRISDAKLVIVGPDDGYLPALKKLVKELKVEKRVFFTGPLYGEDKINAYIVADVYVLPSFYEIFSVTVLEACACGTPVIVTDRCGIADFIVGKAGLVVEYDKDQLRDAIFRVLNDEELRKRFGAGGKKLVRAEFGWDKVVTKVEQVYLNMKRT